MLRSGRTLLAPEVIQSSGMDCGPAALKCLLEGFGISASYGRLREACQTDVDGTSINTLEEIACQLGLHAEQTLLPKDLLLLPEMGVLPGILVVWLPGGMTHFLVVWRRHGSWLQVMDPAIGRRWMHADQLLRVTYEHTQIVPAAAWRSWAASDEMQKVLHGRLRRVGARRTGEPLLAECLADSSWRSLAALDASLRLVEKLIQTRILKKGAEAAALLGNLYKRAARSELESGKDLAVPEGYWCVRPAPKGASDDGEPALELRGAVIVRIYGLRSSATSRLGTGELQDGQPHEGAQDAVPPIPETLSAVLTEPPSRPSRQLLRLLLQDGALTPPIVFTGLAMAALAVIGETLLLRGLLDIGRDLRVLHQRLIGHGALLLFLAAALILEVSLAGGLLRLGRHLELRLRVSLLEKLPRIADRYFRSRSTFDMAERSHALHHLRRLPLLGGRLSRLTFELLFTLIGVLWLYPGALVPGLLLSVVGLGIPLVGQKILIERDIKLQSHAGALGRFYLDAMLGLTAAHTHNAARVLRYEHEGLLREWVSAGRSLTSATLLTDGLQSMCCAMLSVFIVFDYVSQHEQLGSAILLLYWMLNVPVLAQQIALIAQQYPAHRNRTLRVLELLGAGEVKETEAPSASQERGLEAAATDAANISEERNGRPGVALTFREVSVLSAGRCVLRDVNLEIAAGSHVAIIGRSGAGKSTLVGLLLGWHRPASGEISVDSVPLTTSSLSTLRSETVWVDPEVHLWNRSLFDNVTYGAATDQLDRLGAVFEQADLLSVLEGLPNGLATPLGEGGGLLSGGEGQRTRLGRGLLRAKARLILLDEPFRGLDRPRRQELLKRARAVFHRATLLCVTHDAAETANFDRVLVIEDGRVVEDGTPQELAAAKNSTYRILLDAEAHALARLWTATYWRALKLVDGRLCEQPSKSGPTSSDEPRKAALSPGVPRSGHEPPSNVGVAES